MQERVFHKISYYFTTDVWQVNKRLCNTDLFYDQPFRFAKAFKAVFRLNSYETHFGYKIQLSFN